MHLVFYIVADSPGDASCPQECMNEYEWSGIFSSMCLFWTMWDVGRAHKEAWNSEVQHPEKNVFSISQRVRSCSRLFKHENAVWNETFVWAFRHSLHTSQLNDFVRVGHARAVNVGFWRMFFILSQFVTISLLYICVSLLDIPFLAHYGCSQRGMIVICGDRNGNEMPFCRWFQNLLSYTSQVSFRKPNWHIFIDMRS